MPAAGAFFLLRPGVRGMSAAGAEIGVGREVAAATGTAVKLKDLAAAGRAESGFPGDRLPAVGAWERFRRLLHSCLEGVGEHGRHHESHTHPQAGASLALRL